MDTQQPLVSVAVITYNSEKTVVETLDSVANQAYPNLELIVSDDNSNDKTVIMCREWMETHKSRFARTRLLTMENNTGVSANMNRAENACQGEWIKEIAGDDLLLPNCIRDFVDYVVDHSDALIVFGQMQVMGGDSDFRQRFYELRKESFRMMSQMSHDELYDRVISGNDLPAPAVIISKKLLTKYGGVLNDERIPMMEDWAKWLRLLNDGVSFHFMDKEVVAYRLGGVSTSSAWESTAFYMDRRRLFFYYQWDYLYNRDKGALVERTVEEECRIYQEMLDAKKEVQEVRASYPYQLGKALLAPVKSIKKLLKKS